MIASACPNASCKNDFLCTLGVQLNLFTTPTLGTEESGCCREVAVSSGSTVLKKPLHESSYDKVFNSGLMAGAWYSRLNIYYDHRFINKQMLMLAKPVCREKTRLTSPEVWARVTSKA